MVSNSAKLDCRTKQHTESGVSTSDGSRDMARTRSWRKKKEKKNELEESHKASPTGIASYLRIHGMVKMSTRRTSPKLSDFRKLVTLGKYTAGTGSSLNKPCGKVI